MGRVPPPIPKHPKQRKQMVEPQDDPLILVGSNSPLNILLGRNALQDPQPDDVFYFKGTTTTATITARAGAFIQVLWYFPEGKVLQQTRTYALSVWRCNLAPVLTVKFRKV